MSQFNIEGKKAIVTGGTRGLGYGIAECFLEAGCEVVIVGSSEKAQTVPEQFRAKGYRCHGVQADLGNPDEAGKAFDKSLDKLGGNLDILVNNAAVQFRCKSDEFPFEEFMRVINTNLISVFVLMQKATNVMKQRGWGRIINISSLHAVQGGICMPAYSASKGGVLQMTRVFSDDCAKYGITYNCVAPGYMDTDMIAAIKQDPAREKAILSRVAVGRLGNQDDLKGICLYLASDASSFTTGAFIPVDGGHYAMG